MQKGIYIGKNTEIASSKACKLLSTYDYYAHGPLATSTIGDAQVETSNYAYTLQGWSKGRERQLVNF